jgi:chromosome segregation ATPase
MKFSTAVAVATVAGSATASKVSPVQKVIQLLGELKVKVQNDVAAESKAMDEYTEFCDDEITEKKHSIEVAASDIEAYNAVIEESNGKITELSSVLADAGSEIAAKQGELKGAKELRATENGDFKAAQKELVDSVDMLARATQVLKRELSFAQGKGKKAISAQLKNAVGALSAIVNAAWVDPASVKKVQAFLEEDDLSLAQQPQASSYNYESKSGGIVATIEDMQDKAEEQLNSLRKEEMTKKFNFEMLQQSLTDAVANLEKEVGEATSSKSAAEEKKASAESDLSKTEESKAADEKYKGTMTMECQNKAEEWAARQKSATGEVEAIEKAKEILASGVKAMFIQAEEKTVTVKASLKNDSRSKLVHLLKKMGRQYNSFGLMQIANKAKSDPFVKIRGLIEDMIVKLEKQAAEEATHDAWCKEENTKSKASRDAKIEKVEKYTARKDKAVATVATLKQEIAELGAQLKDIAAATAEATKIRADENAAYKKASTDFKDSAEAVAQAVEVLREYYGSAALIQMKQPSFASANSDSGSNIISFLEVAQSDFTRLLAESEAEEAEAKKAFETLMQESAVSKATKEAEVKGKTSEVKSLEVAIADTTNDLETSSKELDAVMEYIEKLKPQCESRAMTYEERKAARDEEVAGLKQALEILAGDAPALTSFVQIKKHFMARK